MAAVKKTPVAKTKVTPTVEKEDTNLNEELALIRQELEDLKNRKGSETPTNVDRVVEDFGMKVKRQCDLEDKVEINPPFNEINPSDNIIEINLSGYKWQIKRGERTLVPKSIADIYEESYRKTIEATSRIKFVFDKPIMSL